MRNRKKQEAKIYLSHAEFAARKALTVADDAMQLLRRDMAKPDTHRFALKLAATRALAAAEAAGKAATDINPDRFENTELWDVIFEAHTRALNASFEASRTAEAIKGWLG